MKVPTWIGWFRTKAAGSPCAATHDDAALERAEACKQRGNEHLAKGELDAAINCYREAVAIVPDYAEAHCGLGVVLAKLERPEEAIACFRSAASLDASSAEAHYNLGNTLLDCGRHSDALAPLRQAIRLAPDFAPAHYNLGNALLGQGRLDEALVCFRQAIRLDPDNRAAHNNLRTILHKQGRLAEAIGSYEMACSLHPDDASLHCYLGMTLLACGRLDCGWEHYEFRFAAGTRKRIFAHPEWTGDQLDRKALLIWKEQGIGDEIMFASLFSEAIARAGRCVIECAPKLVPLFTRSFPRAKVVPGTTPPHVATSEGIDIQCAAGSLARWLRPNLDSFPKRQGYLVPDEDRVAYWKQRLMRLGAGPKVGICWRSSLRSDVRDLHYTRLDQWGPIFAVPGVHFISLQYDECAAELDEARRRFQVDIHTLPEVDLFDDLDEAAAVTRALDLVISTSTTAGALAAALGVPTWTMAFGDSWHVHSADNDPWFPSMRCFSLRNGQSWADVIEQVAGALAQFVRPAPDERSCLPVPRAVAAEGWRKRGDAYAADGRPEDAAVCYRRAIELVPTLVPAYLSLMQLLQQRGEADMVELLLRGGVAINPDEVALLMPLGSALLERGDPDTAVACYKRGHELAIRRDDTQGVLSRPAIAVAAEELKTRGNARLAAGDLEGAAACYREAIALEPAYADPCNNLGVVLLKQDCVREATAFFWRALAIEPRLANAHLNCGNALMAEDRLDEAMECFRAALALEPRLAEAHNNLGKLLEARDRIDDALDSVHVALSLNPDLPEAHYNLGTMLIEKGRPHDAIVPLRRAVELKDNFIEARFSLAVALLSSGRLGEGWSEYRCRFQIKDDNPIWRNFSPPEWMGEPLDDKRILVWGEQGIGDEILFAGLFGEISAHAAACVIECTHKLVPLFARSFPDAVVVARTEPPQPATLQSEFDLQIAAADAARWLRPDLASFPHHSGYLRPDAARTEYWKARLAELGSGLKVGICWRSRLVHGRRRLHYTSLDQWESVFAVPGVHFVNLQYDECRDELDSARQRFGVALHAFTEVDLHDDLDEAAALTKALDLVVSAPTAVSALAAALGVPTWMTYNVAAWDTHGASHHPWFPAMRLYPRGDGQNWEEVMAVIADHLKTTSE